MINRNIDSKSRFKATSVPLRSRGYSSKTTPNSGDPTRPTGSKASSAHSGFIASQTPSRPCSSFHAFQAEKTPDFQSHGVAQKAAPAFEVRSSRAKDVDSIINIDRDAFEDNWPEDYFRNKWYFGGHITLVAEKARSSTGSRHVAGFVDYQLANKKVHIMSLATAAQNRRKGIGRSLMMECIERGRQEDATSVNLEVRKSNEPAIHLYESLGFQPTGVQERYYPDGEDAILMNLKLKS